MSAARKLEIVAPDPFALVRGIRRMRAAGFAVEVENGGLVVESTLELSEPQRAFIGAHKLALVALLEDAEILYRALVQAGPVGLDWREGTPADWDDTQLLVAGEVLYSTGRMVNAHGRRYAAGYAPAIEVGPEYPPADCVPETAPHAATDSPPADPLADRVAQLIASGWSPWNARARAEAETNRPKVSP